MLTQDQKKLYEETILVKEEEIKHLQSEVRDAREALIRDAIECVAERFGNLQPGDKVEVTYQDWGQVKKTTLFFTKYYLPYYFGNNYEKSLKVKFSKCKKDGTPSLRDESIAVNYILSMEKVNE